MLKLDKLREEDIYQIMKWRMKPDITKYMFTDPKLTKKSQKEWYDKISQDKKVKYWIINYNNKKIGVVNLYDIDHKNKRCFWAYYIADTASRNIKLAQNLECNIYDYVFFKLKINKLCSEVLEENKMVIKIHQLFGTKIEGSFQKHILKNKKYYNVIRMAILREGWIELKNKFTYDKIKIE